MKLQTQQQRLIAASTTDIYNTLCDYPSWLNWSPWLIHEPNADVQYSDEQQKVGSWCRWDGKIIGTGKITHQQLTPNQSIIQNITFSSPVKSRGQIRWHLEEQDHGTLVSWSISSSVPLLQFFRRNIIQEDFNKDCTIALNRLARHLGDTNNTFDLSIEGIQDIPAKDYFSKVYQGDLAGMKQAMQQNYPDLRQLAEKKGIEIADLPLAIYHQFNPKTHAVSVEMAIPTRQQTSVAPGIQVGKMPAQRYLRTKLVGNYEHLELAWYTAFSHVRLSKAKFLHSKPFLERYVNNPHEAKREELVTYLDIPIK